MLPLRWTENYTDHRYVAQSEMLAYKNGGFRPPNYKYHETTYQTREMNLVRFLFSCCKHACLVTFL